MEGVSVDPRNTALPVLDHGFVRLVDSMGSDLSIVRSARVSYDAAWRAGADEGKDEKLINFLYNNGHNTPFESVTLTFEVKAPIFVIRQWHRHRTWSYNEVSARYTELPAEFYVPKADHIGEQSKGNKQCRDIHHNAESHTYAMSKARTMMGDSNAAAFSIYRALLSEGVPRELARTVLPLATYTHMFATVNLNNLFKFLGERLHPHAQWEIQQYAQALLQLAEPIAPVAVAAFKRGLSDGSGR